jgi:hypothetical protein
LHNTHLKLLHLQCSDNLFRLRLLWRLLLQSAGSRLLLLGCCLLEDGLPARLLLRLPAPQLVWLLLRLLLLLLSAALPCCCIARQVAVQQARAAPDIQSAHEQLAGAAPKLRRSAKCATAAAATTGVGPAPDMITVSWGRRVVGNTARQDTCT